MKNCSIHNTLHCFFYLWREQISKCTYGISQLVSSFRWMMVNLAPNDTDNWVEKMLPLRFFGRLTMTRWMHTKNVYQNNCDTENGRKKNLPTFPWENLQNIHICAVSLVRDVVTYRETGCLCLLRNFPHTCWFFFMWVYR